MLTLGRVSSLASALLLSTIERSDNMNNPQTEWKIGMTVDEAAAYTGIGRNTLRSLIKNKKLPVLRVGRRIIIRIDVLDRFLITNQDIDLLDLEKVVRVN